MPLRTLTQTTRRCLWVSLAAAFVGAACAGSAGLTTENAAPAPDPTAAVDNAAAPPDAELPATPEASPTPPTPALLTVNDTNAVGVKGDELLSLVEAVKLANGRLTRANLSDAENALIVGDPGPDVADTISVEVGLGTEILLPGGNVWIIEMFGNAGDTIQGGGAILTGGAPEDGVSHNALLIGSARVTIESLTFTDVTNAIRVESAGNQLNGITIRNNAFIDVVVREITVVNSVSGGIVAALTIANNSFSAPQRKSNLRAFVTIRGGVGIEGQTTTAARVEVLEISGNTMAAGAGAVANCISISGGHVAFGIGSRVRGSSVTDVAITNNTMVGCDTAVQLIGGVVEQTDATVTGNVVARVTLRDNTISTVTTGIAVYGGRMAPVPGSLEFSDSIDAEISQNRVESVSVSSTMLSDADVGIRLVGGEFDVDGSGGASGNAISEITADGLASDNVTVFCEEVTNLGPLASGNSLAVRCTDIGTG